MKTMFAAFAVFCVCGSVCLCVTGDAQASKLHTWSLADWQKAIGSAPIPGKGCFTAHYPNTSWSKVACTKAPNLPQGPARGAHSREVGHGNDYTADVTDEGVTIGAADGRFHLLTGLSSETNYDSYTKKDIPNRYSLQLNSQFFDAPPACQGRPGCQGWQQFIYDQPHGGFGGCPLPFGSACVYIQYWLLGYGRPCPQDWIEYDPADCFVNSPANADVPTQPLSSLRYLHLYGTAHPGGIDAVVLQTPDGSAYASNVDDVLELSSYWKAAEYNVVGEYNGSEAKFNPGTRIGVRIHVSDGLTIAPKCTNPGEGTAEKNNLNLGPPSTCKEKVAFKHHKYPVIKFPESN